MRALLLLSLVTWATVIGTPLASAQAAGADPANVVEARSRVTRGEALFERGDYDAALAEFEAAYEVIGEHPSRYLIQYNIAQCHERRFRYDVAITYYQRYLELGGTRDEGHAAVEQTIHELEALLAHVVVTTHAVGARTFIDGRDVGPAPGEVLVPAGLHVLSVRAPGHVTVDRSFELPAGGHLDVTLEPTRLSDEYRGISPIFAITLGALALVGLGVGIGLGVAALDGRDAVDQRLADPIDRWNVTASSLDGIRSLALGADLSYAGAALFGVTALVLGILADWSFGAPSSTPEDDDASSAPSVSVSASVDPSGIGARIVGAF